MGSMALPDASPPQFPSAGDDPHGTPSRGLDERLAVLEARLDRLLAAVAALAAHADRTDGALDRLRAALEPARLAVLGSPAEEVARRTAYLEMVARLRHVVRRHVPAAGRVLVIGRGDEELVDLSGRRAGHFPQDAAGDFAGEYPADGRAAVAHLEALAARGWDHLVVPATSAWWLDHYRDLRIHLHRDWHALHRDPETCLVFARDPARPGPWNAVDDLLAMLERDTGRLPAILDWDTGADLADFLPGRAVFPPVESGTARLPYLERSIDVVAFRTGDDARRAEARRMASAAVVEIAPPGAAGPGYVVRVERVSPDAAAGRNGFIVPQARP